MIARFVSLIILLLIGWMTTLGQSTFFTYTGISGFYDYQANYRAPQYIRACPNTSFIHAIMMIAEDSLNISSSRRTAYAFSPDGGATWNTFNDVTVPPRRSGYPSLDIAQGSIANAAILANHNSATVLQSFVYVDYPAGTGAFAELSAVPLFGSDEPLFPETAGAADGSIILVASRAASTTTHRTRTSDYVTWQPWSDVTLDFISDGYVAEGNTAGHIGIAIAAPESPLQWLESTDNGATWPSSITDLLPTHIPAGQDSFVITPGFDLAYRDADTLITFGVTKLINGTSTQRFSGIGFYSGRSGFVLAVPHDSVEGTVDTLLKRQVNQYPVGYPVIGVSGSNIVVAFQAFMAETSQAGFNYADVFLTSSSDGGNTWSHPANLSNTQDLDERYASMSKWNSPGQANMVYQEDSEPGSGVFGSDNAPVSRNRQRFCRVDFATAVEEPDGVPVTFALYQNYPNPFNPATIIKFQIPNTDHVSLKVFDVLGREVATLVDEMMQPGSYERVFDANGLASGVYLYQSRAGSFVQTRKLLLLR